MLPRAGFCLGVVLMLAGCTLLPGGSGDDDRFGGAPPVPPGVVVADIGPGANLYHKAFGRSGPEWEVHPCQRVHGLPCDTPVLDLTFGDDYEASVAADAALWQDYELDQVYWVRGTNLLVMTQRESGNRDSGHGHNFHGSASAGAVATACPDCYVLVLQDGRSLDGEPVRHIAESLPWVDLVTSTHWPDGGYPNYVESLAWDRYRTATKALHDSGRLFFGATGNTYVTAVTPYPYPDVMLPPWVVLVGGAHSECAAQELGAGHPLEFAGDFTQYLPDESTRDGMYWASGTSFAAPAMAGTFGAALLAVRQARPAGEPHEGVLWRGGPTEAGPLADGDLTHEELRAAFAAHSRYFATTEFEPLSPTCNIARTQGALPAPVGPAPWVDLGWGHAGPHEASAVAAWLLGEAPDPDPKPAEAAAWMDAVQAMRAAVRS